MCGRAAYAMSRGEVARAAGLPVAGWRDAERYEPRYNAAPGSWLAVVRPASHEVEGAEAAEPDALASSDAAELHDTGNAQEELQLQSMRWGLVPSFTPSDGKPDFWKAFNARCETVAEKPLFRRLLRRKRCLVLMNSFYEFRSEGSPALKQPYNVHGQNEEVLRAAALYDRWESSAGAVYTVTILTKDAGSALRWLHDRQPVFLSEEDATAWLHTPACDVERLLQRLASPDASPRLAWHPVSVRLNKGDHDDPDCLTPMKREVEKNAGSVAALFARHSASPSAATTEKRPREEAQPKAVVPSSPTKRSKAQPQPLPKGQRSLASFLAAGPA